MNNVYVGGAIVNQWGTFKRNKRDIIKEFQNNGDTFELLENMSCYYNKALIYQNKNNKKHIILVSYNTIVAEIKDIKFIIHGYYSQTTAKHINTFLYKMGLVGFSKKEIENIAEQWQKIEDFKK